MMVIKRWQNSLSKETSILPLAIFRATFGLLMAFSMIRFLYKGWIEDCYIKPSFHFTYQFFGWVKPYDISIMYGVIILCAVSALCVGLGFFYRLSTILFFFSFTYLELIEKSWYLNHYYFVSLVAFLLLIVPAHKNYALDAKFKRVVVKDTVPNWMVFVFKLQLCIVYFFGGIAKLKSDWLLEAQPLQIWLKAKTDIPIIGWLFEYDITPFVLSWSGMLYDLLIPFLLWSQKYRPYAYILVIVFHVLTHVLFNIGMFPWLMIFGSLLFISKKEWDKLSCDFFMLIRSIPLNTRIKRTNTIVYLVLLLFFSIQSVIPIRHYFLTNNVLWTENGLRFAWHVMVMEKNGYVTFIIEDNNTDKSWKEHPSSKLTTVQEKQMSFQPDMIWQYAQYLKNVYQLKGFDNISIYANSKVSLNGRPSQDFINPNKDLLTIKRVNDIYDFIKPVENSL